MCNVLHSNATCVCSSQGKGMPHIEHTPAPTLNLHTILDLLCLVQVKRRKAGLECCSCCRHKSSRVGVHTKTVRVHTCTHYLPKQGFCVVESAISVIYSSCSNVSENKKIRDIADASTPVARPTSILVASM